MNPIDDDEEAKDRVLEMLGGEVDDYAGSKLEGDDDKSQDASQGVTIEIAVKPHGAEGGEEPEQAEEDEGHDDVKHALGMCCGGNAA